MKDVFKALRPRTVFSHSINCFPPLPIELVRDILEFAAVGDRTTALHLILVSKEVHNWTAPLLYRTVILYTPERLKSFQDLIVAQRSTSVTSVALHVKDLFIRSMSKLSICRAVDVLAACKHVERLVVDSLYRMPTVDKSIQWPTPWEIVFLYGAGSWLHKDHPVLRNVTHIQLDRIIFNKTLDICVALPRLTHLGMTHSYSYVADDNTVYNENFLNLVKRSLSRESSLEMVLVKLQPVGLAAVGSSNSEASREIWADLAEIEDERLLVREVIEPALECIQALEAGKNVWDTARIQFANWRTLAQTHRLTVS